MKILLTLSALFLVILDICAQQWNYYGVENITAGSQTEMDIDSEGTPYVAYVNSAINVVRYDGTGWVSVGGAVSPEGTFEPSIAIDAGGTPYVAYNYGSSTKKANVKKFDGNDWVYVGDPEFSGGLASYLKVRIARDGVTPYVCFSDNANARKATVMKYNGSAWVSVGNPGISSTAVAYTSLAFAPDGTIYLAYQLEFGSAAVMKFNGSTWVGVGEAGFTTGSFIDIEIDASGTPYVASMDDSNAGKGIVMKFDGSDWITVGDKDLSTGMARRMNIEIDNLTPYIAYQNQIFLENGVETKVAIQKFNGTSWVILGEPPTEQYNIDYPSLAIDPNGVPYVAFGSNSSVKVLKYSCAPPPPTDGTEPSLLKVCPDTKTTLTARVSEGNTIFWYDQQVAGSVLGEGENFLTESLTQNKSFYASAANNCGVSTRLEIPVTLWNKPAITIGGNVVVCKGESTTLRAFGATTYEWENGPEAAEYIVKPDITTDFVVTGSDVNACTNTTSVTVIVNALPDINIVGKQQLCPGESTTLTATGANTFQWKGGPATATYSVVPSATAMYSVKGTDSNQCTNADSVMVEINEVNINISIDGNTLISDATPASYQWINCDINTFVIGETRRTFTPGATGNYAVLVSQNLCMNTSECKALTFTSAEIYQDRNVEVYPNPSKGTAIIRSVTKGKVIIKNNIGQTIQVLKLNSDNEDVEIDDLSDGVYHLIFIGAHGRSHSKLIVRKENQR